MQCHAPCFRSRAPQKPLIGGVVSRLDCLGIRAQSRSEYSGEAKQAIAIFRKHTRQRGLLLYGAWHYNVPLAAEQAIECGADGIEMPDTVTSELYAYIMGVLTEVQNGASVPTTVTEHVERLKRYITPKSPFWKMQDFDVPGRKIF